MSKVIKPIKWEDADFKWNISVGDTNYKRETSHIEYTWDDVFLVEIALGGNMEDMPWTQWGDTDERKKSLIKLICKVQGKTIIKEKYIKNYKITVSDIKVLAEKVLGIEVITENIKF
tara:strand:- start:166 stop:516 length:351 start_codon:yes stop_codon:yes gene_type:complete